MFDSINKTNWFSTALYIPALQFYSSAMYKTLNEL